MKRLTHPEEELPPLVPRFDPEGVVHVGEDAGGLNLEDVGGDGALRGDAHVAVDDGERQISTEGLVDGTHTAAAHTQGGKNHLNCAEKHLR